MATNNHAKLKTLRLCVADVEESKSFYSRLFEVSPCEEIENFVSFDLSATRLEMVCADMKNPLSTGGSVGYFEVANLDEYIARGLKLGATVWRGPLRVNDDGWTIVQIKDVSGNIIGFEGVMLPKN